jgi:hypothetical protein
VKLDVRLDPRLSGLCAGARLAGTVATGAGGDARSVDAWLELTEHASGHRHVARRTDPLRLHDGAVPPGHELRFALRIPPGAVPSLATEWGALVWTLVVRADRPGAPEARAEVVLEIL